MSIKVDRRKARDFGILRYRKTMDAVLAAYGGLLQAVSQELTSGEPTERAMMTTDPVRSTPSWPVSMCCRWH
jgi:hypothetical protein